MGSLYLNRLTPNERVELEQTLWNIQSGKCFICEEAMENSVQPVQIDHVIPIKVGGKDDKSNFALTHSYCNESKQDADLRVARVLARFNTIRDACLEENRGPDLSDVLRQYGGAKYELSIEHSENGTLRYSLPEAGDISVYEEQVRRDKLSNFEYFFVDLPIEYLFHDDRINPRSIGQNIAKLVKEFFSGMPQLHVALAWIDTTDDHDRKIRVFDGQHKAAAQVLLGTRALPIRVFVNPDLNILLTANTHAGTTLRQVAFDKSVQRHLGSALYIDRVERYQKERDLAPDDYSFSERELVSYYKGEAREMKRYILDSVRDGITHHPNNKLQEFVELGGRGKENRSLIAP